MQSKLLSAALCGLVLILGAPVFAQSAKPNIEALDQAEAERVQVEQEAVDSLSFGTEGYQNAPTFKLKIRDFQSAPQPSNPGSVINTVSLLNGADAFYGQLQTGTFGTNNVGDQWAAFGSPGAAVTGIYGLRYNWAQDFATFGLTNVSTTRKDVAIGFGSGTDTQLNFNFINTALVPTTVATLFPAAGFQVKSSVRQGIETGTTQLPSVGTTTGPAVIGGTTFGYTGLVSRRINDTAFGIAGRVLARTDALTLEKDGTNGGLRIGYPVASGLPNVACTGVTSTGAVIGRAFIPTAGAVGGVNQIFTDAQGVVFVTCSFGDSFLLNNITSVSLQRYPGDYYWVGSVTSTYNQ